MDYETLKKIKRDYSSTQFNLTGDIRSRVIGMSRGVSDGDLSDKGRETEPHITIKYGIDVDEVEAIRIIRDLAGNMPPVAVRLDVTSVFTITSDVQRGGQEFDVVKVDVDSQGLRVLNATISSLLKCVDSHSVYRPHITLAYVKPGRGEAYAGWSDVLGETIFFDRIVFSGASGKKVIIPLLGSDGSRVDGRGDGQSGSKKKIVFFENKRLITLQELRDRMKARLADERLSKANPNHDERGRFASTSGGPTKASPAVQSWASKKFKNPEHAKAFVEWFGDSKAVNDRGEPLVVYHGTSTDIKDFSSTRIGEFGPATYTTSDPDEAGAYAKSAKGNAGANILPLYLSLQNPFVGDAESYYKKFGTDNTKDSDENTKQAAIKAGYDGIISKREEIDWSSGKPVKTGKVMTHYIVFSPTQIKSATGNQGTYSPHVTDINKSNPNHDEHGRFATGSSHGDGDRYFNDIAFKSLAENTYKSREKLTHMSPDDFLKMAEKLDSPVPSKTATVDSVLSENKKFESIPSLTFVHDGNGNAEVVGHEGRHRALALKKLGVGSMPVILSSISGKGAAIRWDQQGNEKSFDRIKGEWPKTLKGQERGDVMPFPVGDMRKTQAKAADNSPKITWKKDQNSDADYSLTYDDGKIRASVFHLLGAKGGMNARSWWAEVHQEGVEAENLYGDTVKEVKERVEDIVRSYEKKKREESIRKINPNHDNRGRFATGSSGSYASASKKSHAAMWLSEKFSDPSHAEAFKKWFGDFESNPSEASKVVDDKGVPQETHSIPSTGSKVMRDGVPVVVYHGTAKGGFEEFDKSKAEDGVYGPGFYFTESKKVADTYKKDGKLERGAKRETKSVYLNIRKPFDFREWFSGDESEKKRAIEILRDEATRLSGIDKSHAEVLSNDMESKPNFKPHTLIFGGKAFVSTLQRMGYDGVTFVTTDSANFGKAEPHRVWIAFEPTQIKSTDNHGSFDPSDPNIRKSLKDRVRGAAIRKMNPNHDGKGRFASGSGGSAANDKVQQLANLQYEAFKPSPPGDPESKRAREAWNSAWYKEDNGDGGEPSKEIRELAKKISVRVAHMRLEAYGGADKAREIAQEDDLQELMGRGAPLAAGLKLGTGSLTRRGDIVEQLARIDGNDDYSKTLRDMRSESVIRVAEILKDDKSRFSDNELDYIAGAVSSHSELLNYDLVNGKLGMKSPDEIAAMGNQAKAVATATATIESQVSQEKSARSSALHKALKPLNMEEIRAYGAKNLRDGDKWQRAYLTKILGERINEFLANKPTTKVQVTDAKDFADRAEVVALQQREGLKLLVGQSPKAKVLSDIIHEDLQWVMSSIRGGVKNEISRDVGARIGQSGLSHSDATAYLESINADYVDDGGHDVHRAIAQSFLDQWAGSSGDSDPRSVALQHAVAKLFGLDTDDLGGVDSKSHKAGLEQYNKYKAVYDVGVQAMYDNTQARLASAGIDEMTLYRGMAFSRVGLQSLDREPQARVTEAMFDLAKHGSNVKPVKRDNPDGILSESELNQAEGAVVVDSEVTSNPLSSYSWRLSTAIEFSDGEVGTIVTAVIPRKNIFSTAFTGNGCLSEHEVVVIGETVQAKVLIRSNSYRRPMLEEGDMLKIIRNASEPKHAMETA